MSNIADLKAALILEAADISDSIDKLECLSLIDDWYACRVALAAFEAGDVQSYSIAGRSVTRRDTSAIRTSEASYLQQIKSFLGRSGGCMDMSAREHNAIG